MTHRTRRRRRRPAWLGYNEPRPRRRRRTRRRRRYSGFLGNPRRSRRRRYYRNAPGHRRRYRRNPNGLRLDRPMTWAPYLLTGAVAATATASLPRFFGPAVTAPMTYLIQGGIAIGGAFVFPMLGFRQAHGLVWFLVSGAVIAADFIRRWLGPTLGLAAYPFEAQATLAGMGQEPYYPPTLYPMYPAEPVEVGAYPYQEVGEYAPGPGSYAVAPGGVPYGE